MSTLAALAADKVKPVNAPSGKAVKGYDVVAYFADGKPVKGADAISFSWNGAEWHFATAAHREAFAKQPEKYAPQFGGYCAWAVSNNYTADVDPAAWRIVDGKLFLNYNLDVQKKWAENLAERIAQGEKNWPQLHQ